MDRYQAVLHSGTAKVKLGGLQASRSCTAASDLLLFNLSFKHPDSAAVPPRLHRDFAILTQLHGPAPLLILLGDLLEGWLHAQLGLHRAVRSRISGCRKI